MKLRNKTVSINALLNHIVFRFYLTLKETERAMQTIIIINMYLYNHQGSELLTVPVVLPNPTREPTKELFSERQHFTLPKNCSNYESIKSNTIFHTVSQTCHIQQWNQHRETTGTTNKNKQTKHKRGERSYNLFTVCSC